MALACTSRNTNFETNRFLACAWTESEADRLHLPLPVDDDSAGVDEIVSTGVDEIAAFPVTLQQAPARSAHPERTP